MFYIGYKDNGVPMSVARAHKIFSNGYSWSFSCREPFRVPVEKDYDDITLHRSDCSYYSLQSGRETGNYHSIVNRRVRSICRYSEYLDVEA